MQGVAGGSLPPNCLQEQDTVRAAALGAGARAEGHVTAGVLTVG